MTSRLTRRTGALVLIAVAATAALSGCSGVLGATMTYNDTEKAKITDISLAGGSGDVEIATVPTATQTTIQRIVKGSTNPDSTYSVSGTTLTLNTSCGSHCLVSYKLQVPPGVDVGGKVTSGDLKIDGVASADVQSKSGDVTVRDTTGPVKIKVTSGDVRVLTPKGPVDVVSTSGDVQAIDAAGPVGIKATSGDIRVTLTAPASVDADATSGDVRLVLPRGDYRVSADDHHSGDVSLHGLVSDPAAKNVLNLRSASGDIDVTTTA